MNIPPCIRAPSQQSIAFVFDLSKGTGREEIRINEGMNADQSSFYNLWRNSWHNGTALDVEGNLGYLFSYVYSVLGQPTAKAINELSRLISAYQDEKEFIPYCQRWLSDCFMIQNDFKKAFDAFPHILINSRSAVQTDSVLNIKLLLGLHISGENILTLNGPRVTNWGKAHLPEISKYVDVIVSAHEKENHINLLEDWKKDSHCCDYFVFSGTIYSHQIKVPYYSFSRNGRITEFISSITTDAENTVREENAIPRIGEGWIAETTLYYEIKRLFPDVQVVQHARPGWLGQQHLDVFIPDYNVAIEYQGEQHDKPIEYFGGEEAFKSTQRRDSRKKRLCTRNGTRLIFVRPSYFLNAVIEEIKMTPMEK